MKYTFHRLGLDGRGAAERALQVIVLTKPFAVLSEITLRAHAGGFVKRAIFISAWVMLLGGCTSMGVLDKSAALESDRHSIIVLGVAPENYRVSVFPGRVANGVFRQNPWLPATVYGAGDDGYLVGEASAGDTLAITVVRVVKDRNAFFRGTNFIPCHGARTMTFSIPGGKVLYLGNVHYQFVGDRLQVKYSQDIDSARRYMDERYPNLRGRLEAWKYQLLPTTAFCGQGGGTIYIPIYIPARR